MPEHARAGDEAAPLRGQGAPCCRAPAPSPLPRRPRGAVRGGVCRRGPAGSASRLLLMQNTPCFPFRAPVRWLRGPFVKENGLLLLSPVVA